MQLSWITSPGKLCPSSSFPYALCLSLNSNHRPGLRERLVLSEKCILTNLFWQNFSQSFRFHWPYTLMETCSIDSKSGYIQFSNTFRNHLRDIRHWRMDHGFFRMFPEFYDDITPMEKICPAITTTLNKDVCSHTEPREEGREGRVSFVHLP